MRQDSNLQRSRRLSGFTAQRDQPYSPHTLVPGLGIEPRLCRQTSGDDVSSYTTREYFKDHSYGCGTRDRTLDLLVQSQVCCQLHHPAILRLRFAPLSMVSEVEPNKKPTYFLSVLGGFFAASLKIRVIRTRHPLGPFSDTVSVRIGDPRMRRSPDSRRPSAGRVGGRFLGVSIRRPRWPLWATRSDYSYVVAGLSSLQSSLSWIIRLASLRRACR